MKEIRRIEKEREGEGERQSAETLRAVSRLALLHNFIALSPVFATQRKKGRKRVRDVLLFLGIPANMTVYSRNIGVSQALAVSISFEHVQLTFLDAFE